MTDKTDQYYKEINILNKEHDRLDASAGRIQLVHLFAVHYVTSVTFRGCLLFLDIALPADKTTSVDFLLNLK